MDATAHADAVKSLVDAGCIPSDPVPWILGSGEPYAVWFALTRLRGAPDDDAAVLETHASTVSDPAVAELLNRLPAAPEAAEAGHHSPQFLPNRLRLLAELGLRRGDDPRLDAVLGDRLSRFDSRGRFTSAPPTAATPRCDANAVTEVMLRFGFGSEPVVRKAVSRLIAEVEATAQGRAWGCTVEKRPVLSAFAKHADACPQISLEGIRVLGLLPPQRRPKDAIEIARVPLRLWRRRVEERPHEFGHGYQFKTVKWPSYWYDALAVSDALGAFPELWSGPAARAEDRSAMAEILACLLAYNLDRDGRVTPKRTHRGYENFSFGRKTAPSPFATALTIAAAARFSAIATDIAAVDTHALPSSRGGSERAVPPTDDAPAALGCAEPERRSYPASRILPRILGRHHLDTPWEPQNLESITSDIVGIPAGSLTTPYLSLAARIPDFSPLRLDQALHERRSLVPIRCMRGQLYAVRRDFIPVVHAASVRQVVRRAQAFARAQGVSAQDYERLAPAVLEACEEEPLTVRALRARLRPDRDLGAIVTLMAAERVLLAVPASEGRYDRRRAYTPFSTALPEVDLGQYSEDEARARLLRAYVRGFGPVTRQDAAWWTGMDLKRVRRALEALEDELVEVRFNERDGSWLMHAADAEELERATLMETPNVAVLPANDPLLVGYANRSLFIDDAVRPYVFDPVGNAAPVVLIDGRVAAVWDLAVDASGATTALVFPTAPIGAGAAERLSSRVRRVARIRYDAEETPVANVTGMKPLSERPVGAFRHPLREARPRA